MVTRPTEWYLGASLSEEYLVSVSSSQRDPIQGSYRSSYRFLLTSLCVAALWTAPVMAQGDKAADEGEDKGETPAEEKPATPSKDAKDDTTSGEEGAAPSAAKPVSATAPQTTAQEPGAPSGGDYSEPAEGPADWPAGKPPGSGPQGWPDGKTAKDFDNPDQEAPGGASPNDGIGVACEDYIECVCTMSDITKGKTIGGYNHSGTCTVAKTYTTAEYEDLCAEELDQLKDALEDAEEDYKANGIKLPAACG